MGRARLTAGSERAPRVAPEGEAELLKKAIETEKAPRPVGPYSQGLAAGGFIFVSGQVGFDPSTGGLAGDDVGSQTERALKNVSSVLEAAGAGLDRVVKVNVFLLDMDDFATMNEVYGRFFGAAPPPARTTVAVARLPLGALVEVEAVAILGDNSRRGRA